MPNTPITIAIYPRKSIYTGKGESVQTQVDLCRDYCDAHYDNPTYLVYDEDEGFSGGNTNRPAFQRMLRDARAHKFSVLCCYRLDRISRNVSDFSHTLDELQVNHITFVSLREQFDTSSPMGRAMIYIASVFAQLERDTIAERVRDNLHALAREGHWLGGNTPTGFISKRIEFTRNGKQRAFMTLEETPEMNVVRTIQQKFLSLGSLAGVETYCLQNSIKSKFGNDLSRMAIRSILSNPVYCTADKAALEFFLINDFELCSAEEEFDSVHGILPFNRTQKPAGGTSTPNATSEWIIAVGQHTGTISGEEWVRIQMMLEENKDKGYRKPRTNQALLSGLLVCGKCGGYMRPKAYGKPLEDGSRRFAYLCALKEHSHNMRCDMKNAPGNDVDNIVVERLLSSVRENGIFWKKSTSDILKSKERTVSIQESIDKLQAAIAEKEGRITNLISALSYDATSAVKEKIVEQMNELQQTIVVDKQHLARMQTDLQANEEGQDIYSAMVSIIEAFASSFETLSHDERRRMLKNMVEKVVWDGENIEIQIFGEKRLPK